jgi:hypothetical protein
VLERIRAAAEAHDDPDTRIRYSSS